MDATRFHHIDSLRWHVLDALSDDWESPEQIKNYLVDFPGTVPTIDELGEIIHELFQTHYIFLTLNTLYDHDQVMKELRGETPDRLFWFGRTDIGYLAWDTLSEKYAPKETKS